MFASEAEAYALLERLQIAYERCDHIAITSVVDLPFELPGQQVKNLFLKNKKARKFYLVILHDEKQADLKALSERLGEKRLSFASDEKVVELLHVQPGTITPFSLIFDVDHNITVVVDQDVDQTATVGFHPFVNTTTLNIAYRDFERILRWTGHEVRIVNCGN